MASNNAHLDESKEDRLKRFQNGHPIESIQTLLDSINNFFNNEIRATIDNKQTSLMIMGMHATILTVAEVFFNDKGLQGYKIFLEKYVDSDNEFNKFSTIARDIHEWRNILAHQWLSSKGHSIGYNYSQLEGWKRIDGILFINPQIYCENYLAAFRYDGKIWKYNKDFTDHELELIKMRIINKYVNT